MNYLGELFEQRVGRHLVACRVIRDVRFDSPGDDEHHLNVLVEIAAFHGKGIGHQVERTLRRGVNPVPWDHAVGSVIGQLISVMGGHSHIAGDRSDVHNDPAPLCGHMWNDKLRKPHRGEEVRLERASGSIQIHVQGWAYEKSVYFPSRDRKQVYQDTSHQRC